MLSACPLPRSLALSVALAGSCATGICQQFVSATELTPPGVPGRSILVDIDSDGDLDVVGAISGGSNKIWNNNGDGHFTDVSFFLPNSSNLTQAVAAGDVDGDGDIDLFFGNSFQQDRLLIQQASGFFLDQTSTRLPSSSDGTQTAAFGDIDNDGDVDLIYGDAFAASVLLLNDGSGAFSAAPSGQLPSSSDDTEAIRLLDIDGDGDLDLVEANNFGSNRLRLNNGAGQFTQQPPTAFPLDSDGTFGLAVGDIDGDGDLDIAFANGLGPNTLYVNQGNNVFVDESNRYPTAENNTASFGAAFTDVDQDGDLDLVWANSFAQDQLWLNDGSGVFADATSRLPQGANASSTAAAADLDRDGDEDVWISSRPDGFLLNRFRQLRAPAPPVQGQDWVLELSSAPGFESTMPPPFGFVFFSLAAAPMPIPFGPFGDFLLTPGTALLLGPLPIPAPAGTTSIGLPIPPSPPLSGLNLYAQGLVFSATGGIRLTSRVRGIVQ